MDEYDRWNEAKKMISHKTSFPTFYEREVWWYTAGKNLGAEIDGKGEHFTRPILIIRKYGSSSFFGVPLSTQVHSGRWYSTIIVRGIMRDVMLSQATSLSASRLINKICRLSVQEAERISSDLARLLLKK